MVFSLVYVSVAADDLTRTDLRTLVEQSRRNNSAADVTGVLLYRNGTFLQMLEGDQGHVEALVDAIRVDPRNRDMVVVRRRDEPARQFPSWTMGLGDIGPASTDLVSIEAVPDGAVHQTETEAAFLRDLLDIFDP